MLYQLSYFRNFGSPWGNRTPLARMKILSTNRYTNGPSFKNIRLGGFGGMDGTRTRDPLRDRQVF